MHRLLTVVFFFTCASPVIQAWCGEVCPESSSDDEAGDRAAVLVLQVARGKAVQSREQRFISELKMVLSEIDVKVARLEDTGFTELPLTKQIGEVKNLLGECDALAAIWIARAPSDLLLLHLVAVSTGRALVRLVETELERDAEAVLALAARELLGEAFLFEEKDAVPDESIGKVVQSVREDVGIPEQRAEADHSARAEAGLWGLLAGFHIDGGLAGYKGRTLQLGGELALERRILQGLYARVGLKGMGGLFRANSTSDAVHGWSLAPGIKLAYLFEFDAFRIGPLVGLEVPWSYVFIDIGDGRSFYFKNWGLRVLANLEVRWHLTKMLAILLNAGLGVAPLQEIYRRTSDDKIILATPYLSWNAGLGAAIGF